MGYIQQLLSQNEKILFHTRRHFFVIFGAILKELLILIVLIIGFIALRNWNPPQLMIFEIALGAIAVIALGSLIIDVLAWNNEEYFVTSRRVIHCTGILNKRVLDSSLSKINDVFMQQSFFGRMFGYGTIKILTATEEVINLLDRISRPVDFKHAMLNAKADLEPIIPAAPSALSPGQLLEELAQLRTKNMITEEEYQAKRKEILQRM